MDFRSALVTPGHLGRRMRLNRYVCRELSLHMIDLEQRRRARRRKRWSLAPARPSHYQAIRTDLTLGHTGPRSADFDQMFAAQAAR
jgi:hypothetical protein